MKNKVVTILLAVVALLGGGAYATEVGGLGDKGCSVSTVTMATVGHQQSSTLLSANSSRAWAMIQQPLNATNTVALSFDEGAAATLTSGLSLENASTTIGMTSITFGLNTDLPYTGAVTGLTNTGSTSVSITQCSY